MTGPGPIRVDVPLADGIRTFTVTGLDRDQWANLVHQHPSADPAWRFDATTLYPELLRSCVIDPLLTPELAADLAEDPDTTELVDVALRLTEPGSLDWAKHRLSTDARLASEVALSVRMGIPHDQFARWRTTSQDLALAHAEMAAQVCPGCGVPEQDMRNPYAWEVDLSPGRDCWHCAELQGALEKAAVPEEHRAHVHPRLVRPEAVI